MSEIDPAPFLERLRAAAELGSEDNHMAADQVLLDALRAYGAAEIADAYAELAARGPWWYA